MHSLLRHEKTWLMWINEISPLSPKISNTSLQDREFLAKALAMAVPDGPAGVPCVDECNCHGIITEIAALEIVGHLKKRTVLENGMIGMLLSKIKNALQVDLIRPKPVIPVSDLTQLSVVVSPKNGDVAHARRLYPRTWEILEQIQ